MLLGHLQVQHQVDGVLAVAIRVYTMVALLVVRFQLGWGNAFCEQDVVASDDTVGVMGVCQILCMLVQVVGIVSS